MVPTRILKIDRQAPDPLALAAAAEVIQRGGLVAFPTETVYGLGADALSRDAIARIYEAKERPTTDPIIAHIADITQLELLAVDVPAAAYKLAQHFWPGPLTMVLKRAPHVPDNIAAGRATLAVRMPNDPIARALIQAAGVPIAAPSANTFTRPSATAAAHVLEDLEGRLDLLLDGGSTDIGLESTVIDMTQQPPVVLRPGGVLMEDLRRVIPDVQMQAKYLSDKTAASSPGQMLKHYAPRARLTLFDGPHDAVYVAMCDTAQRLASNQKRVGILVSDDEAEKFTHLGARVISLGASTDLPAIGRRLFGAMRALDAQQVDAILVHSFAREGLGEAIWDRLLRAAEGRVVTIANGSGPQEG